MLTRGLAPTSARLPRWLPWLLALLAAAALPAAGAPPDAAGGAYLGVYLGDAVDGGVEIVALVAGGPAHAAGLHVGDLIVEAGESEIVSSATLGEVMAEMSPGRTLSVVVLRDDGSHTIDVKLGSRAQLREPRRFATSRASSGRGSSWPTPVPAPSSRPVAVSEPVPVAAPPSKFPAPASPPLQSLVRPRALGLEVAEITPALRQHYGAPADAGVLVTRVGTVAEQAGLQIGDVLVLAGGQSIRSRPQLESVLWTWNWQQPVVVNVVREGDSVPLRLEWRWHEETAPTDRSVELRLRALERERAALEDRLRRVVRELEELSGER